MWPEKLDLRSLATHLKNSIFVHKKTAADNNWIYAVMLLAVFLIITKNQ